MIRNIIKKMNKNTIQNNQFTKSKDIVQNNIEQVNKIKINKSKNCQMNDPIQTLLKIKKWRQKNQAPVDVVGCQKLADKNAPDQIRKYQTLISLMLSIQTKDQITGMIVQRLKAIGLEPKIISSMSQEQIKQLIRQTNFNLKKAKNIKEVSQIILNRGLPDNKQALLKLPGIGIKIAMIYLRIAQGKDDGIGVDVHVHRICNRLGWIKTKSPNESQQQLQSLFPRKYWKDLNICFVGFGQILCSAKKPDCKNCPVNNQCPSSSLQF